MKIEPLFNRGMVTLERQFREAFAWADEADLASAYVTSDGLRRIEAALSDSQCRVVRLLVGVYQQFTSPTVLGEVWRLQKRHPGNFTARIARNQRFHWKYFVFRSRGMARVYVGSANLTRDGLTASGELCVRIRGGVADAPLRSLHEEFDRVWSSRQSLPLTQQLIRTYKSGYRRPRVEAPSLTGISKLLEAPERSAMPVQSRRKPRVVFASSEVSPDTVRTIRRETNWEKTNWAYTVFPDRASYEKARDAGVLLCVDSFDSSGDYTLEFHRVRDYHDSILTADGKYFIAHLKIPGSWSRSFRSIRTGLRRVGLTKKKLESDRYLNQQQISVLADLMRTNQARLR